MGCGGYHGSGKPPEGKALTVWDLQKTAPERSSNDNASEECSGRGSRHDLLEIALPLLGQRFPAWH